MASSEPVALDVFFDYHCPYSDRAVAWLTALGPDRVRPTYRFFGLEQVNRDPSATAWRLWEQPLDYEHYLGRPNRRPLHAFLVTAMLEATADAAIVQRFRTAVYRARFDDIADIADLNVLRRLAVDAGADGQGLDRALADPIRNAAARTRIAADWADARAEWAIFGVPTLQLPDGSPFYLRLSEPIPPADAEAAWSRILELRRSVPMVVEIKEPGRVG